jgi:hypothetical protein
MSFIVFLPCNPHNLQSEKGLLMAVNKVKKNENNFLMALEVFKKQSFCSQCSQAGITSTTQSEHEKIKSIVFALGVQYRTIQNWRAGSKVHPSATRLLFNMKTGITQNGAWQSWKVNGNALVSPTNETINPDIIGRLWLWRNERELKERQIIELKAKISLLQQSGRFVNLDIETIKKTALNLAALFDDDMQNKTG